MTADGPLALAVLLAAVFLVAGYAVVAPLFFARALAIVAGRRRLRYRTSHDEVLAASRFTIPVSLVLPLDGGDPDAAAPVRALFALNYPELEVIAVVSGQGGALDSLREAFGLAACELFYRRSVATGRVRAIFRSAAEPRLLVVQKDADGTGDALNCGANLARYRYVGCVPRSPAWHADGLLEAMHAAVENPALVVGISTGVGPAPVDQTSLARRSEGLGLAPALEYLRLVRERLDTIGWRRLDLPPHGHRGFTLWRRDTLIEVGGFATGVEAVHADLTFRIHRHFGADSRRYRLVHVVEPVGAVPPAVFRGPAPADAAAPAAVLWRHRGLLFNPAYGRFGLLDFPRYAFNRLAGPWVERAALIALALGLVAGVFAPAHFLLVLFIVGAGNGLLVNGALLLATEPVSDLRPRTLLTLLLLGPFEFFLGRPLAWLATTARPAA